MTTRARWLLVCGTIGFTMGLATLKIGAAVLSLALLLWIFVGWAYFQFRLHFELPQIQVERFLNDRSRPDETLWVDRRVKVRIEVTSPSRLRDYLRLRDVVPEALAIQIQKSHEDTRSNKRESRDQKSNDGRKSNKTSPKRWARGWHALAGAIHQWLYCEFAGRDGSLLPFEYEINDATRSASWEYAVRPRAATVANYQGVRVTLRDRMSFFEAHRFIPCYQRVRILPDYYQHGERHSSVKRFNSLPRHGIHRLQRTGFGSELLELREYQEGDPPKSIAWKASARRDQLMTRQYESEVPVRVHLIIDGSHSTRIGGFGLRLIDQLNFVAASVAKSASNVGDPVALTLVDEERTRRISHQSGDRGFLRVLDELAKFSDAPPPPPTWLSTEVVEYTLRVLQERYPELLDRRLAKIPFAFSRRSRQRSRISQILGALYDLSPFEVYRCYRDDVAFAGHARNLLHDVGTSWMPPLVSNVTPSDPKEHLNIALVADALTRSVTFAKDNEVFVVMADAVNCGGNVSGLSRAIKLALARHHRVAFVCPSTSLQRSELKIIRPDSSRADDLLLAAEKVRCRTLTYQLQKDLRRLGVNVAFSGEKDAIRMVVNEIEMVRNGGRSVANR